MYPLKKSWLLPGIVLSIALCGCTSTSSESRQQTAIYGNAQSFKADAVATTFVKDTFTSINLPVEVLVPTEEITLRDIESAEYMAQKALNGQIDRRSPLNVLIRGDGRFSIMDGNRTYAMLIKRGAKSIPVTVCEPYSKDVLTLDELISKNKEAASDFERRVKKINEVIGGKLELRQKPKRIERIREKIEKWYQGNPAKVTDVLAGRIIFESGEDIVRAMHYLPTRFDVVALRDSWTHPLFSGFAYVMSYVRTDNGVLGELQLTSKGIMELNELSHDLYEYYRSHSTDKDEKMQQFTVRVNKVNRRVLAYALEDKLDLIRPYKEKLKDLGAKLNSGRDINEAEKTLDRYEKLLDTIPLK